MKTLTQKPTVAPVAHAVQLDWIGTSGKDRADLTSQEGVFLFDAYNGNDFITLYGDGDFDGYLGEGSDTLLYFGRGDAWLDFGIGNDVLKRFAEGGVVDADLGDGNDRAIMSIVAADTIDGGAGYDKLDLKNAANESISESGLNISLTAQQDGTIVGSYDLISRIGDPAATFLNIEQVIASSRDDKIMGSSADDMVYGGKGNDLFQMGAGDDIAIGESGNDTMTGEAGDDRLFGGDGFDLMDGGAGDDYITGGRYSDTMTAGSGEDTVYGGTGNDLILSEGLDSANNPDQAADYFYGGDGRDHLSYENANGRVLVHLESGTVQGDGAGIPITTTTGPFTNTLMFMDTFSGFEEFTGSDFDDIFYMSSTYTETDLVFSGGGGNDRYYATAGDATFNGYDEVGGAGQDIVDYSRSDGASVRINLEYNYARLKAPDGIDWTHALNAIDGVVGTKGNDTIDGGVRDEIIEGHQGNDRMTGGGGVDDFLFRGTSGPLGYDVIEDFGNGADRIHLEAMHFIDGQAVDRFSRLDSNGDGVLTWADDQVYQDNNHTFLLFQEAIIQIDNTLDLGANDFIFA